MQPLSELERGQTGRLAAGPLCAAIWVQEPVLWKLSVCVALARTLGSYALPATALSEEGGFWGVFTSKETISLKYQDELGKGQYLMRRN